MWEQEAFAACLAFDLSDSHTRRWVGPTFPLLGSTLRESNRRRRVGSALLYGAFVVVAPACSAAPSSNVVLVSIDSLRPDHLGTYGYERAGISPHIDALAAEGIVFERALSTTTWTLPAHASMLTGLYPEAHGVQRDGDRIPDVAVLVSEAFRDAGYATRAVVAAPYLNAAFGFDQGWDVYDDVAGVFDHRSENADDSHWGTTSPEVHRRAVEALDAVGSGPFFLFVHYWDVHYDYAPPAPYDTMFDPDYEGTITSLNFYWNDDIRLGMAPRDLRHVVALYDGEIAYTDGYLGLLFDELRARGLWDDTLVVLTADHGDEFFEHGEKGHEKNLYGTTLDVPLIVKLPRAEGAGRRVGEFVSVVDIPATLLDVAGTPAMEVTQGRSLRQMLTAPSAPRSLFASLENGTAIIDEGHKLITVSREGAGDRHYLFDLLNDRGERRNLAGKLVERRTRMVAQQVEWLALAAQARLAAQDIGEVDPAVLERLRNLGYIR